MRSMLLRINKTQLTTFITLGEDNFRGFLKMWTFLFFAFKDRNEKNHENKKVWNYILQQHGKYHMRSIIKNLKNFAVDPLKIF